MVLTGTEQFHLKGRVVQRTHLIVIAVAVAVAVVADEMVIFI
jgi:hypothetical protein